MQTFDYVYLLFMVFSAYVVRIRVEEEVLLSAFGPLGRSILFSLFAVRLS